jgi:hypothetical protein
MLYKPHLCGELQGVYNTARGTGTNPGNLVVFKRGKNTIDA